jgi:hypothetical protein
MSTRDKTTALILFGALCWAGAGSAEVLVFDSEIEWRAWTMPRDLVQVGEAGELNLVRFSREIDAVRDAHLFTHPTQRRGEVRGGIWETGTSSNTAPFLLDGDPTTFWQPDPDDALKQWYVDIDLGRAVLARQIRLRFPDEPGARPLRQFTVYVSTGARIQAIEDIFEFEPVYHTTQPNQATEVIIPLEYAIADSLVVVDSDLDLDLDYENRYQVVQYIGIVAGERHPDAALSEIEVLAVGDNIGIGTRERGAFLNGTVAVAPENLFDADMNTTNLITSGNLSTVRGINQSIGWLTAGTWFYVDLGAVFYIDELFLYSLRQFEGTSGRHRGSTGRGHRILFSDGTPGLVTSLPVPETLDYTELLTHVDPKAQGLYRIRYLFKTRKMRYLFWHGLTDREWFETKWAEWMLFSSGHPAQVVLSSNFIDLARSSGDDRPRIVRSLSWDAELPVGTRLQLRSRSGNALAPIHTFHNKIGQEITEEKWNSSPKVLRGPIDTALVAGEDWGEWSNVYSFSGEAFKSASPRRFVQLEMILSTDDPQVAPTVRSLSIEFDDALVQGARGSIMPRSARPNEDTRFVYTLWPQSDGGDDGFDLLRFALPGRADDISVQIGGENIVPSQVLAQDDSLLVALPQPVKADSVQVSFTTRVVRNATVFGLDLGSSARPGLWQSVEAAERRANIVLLPELTGSARLIDDLRFSTPVLTPNGDGVNDQVEISLVIFKVEAADPRVEIFDLSGRSVARLLPSATGPATHFTWSGRDRMGELVSPGIYLCRVDLGAQTGDDSALHALAVAY